MPITEVAETPQATNLDSLVGPGRKYEDPEALAKAYIHAELHINELRDSISTQESQTGLIEEVLNEVRNQPTPLEPEAVPNPAQATGMSKDDVANIVEAQLTTERANTRAEENTSLSLEMLDRHYGSRSKTNEAIAKVVVDDNSKKVVDNAANVNPQLLFRLITGSEFDAARGAPTNTPGVTQNSGSGPAGATVSLPWSEATRMRKSDDPKDRIMYQSIEYRNRIEAAAAEAEKAGIDYYNT